MKCFEQNWDELIEHNGPLQPLPCTKHTCSVEKEIFGPCKWLKSLRNLKVVELGEHFE